MKVVPLATRVSIVHTVARPLYMAATTKFRYSCAELLLLNNKPPISSKIKRRLWFLGILNPSGYPSRHLLRSTPRNIPVRVTRRRDFSTQRSKCREDYAPLSQERILRSLSRADRHYFRPTIPVSFALLNIRSLHQKTDDVLELQRDHDIDVFLLVETWHDPDSVCISRLRNEGFCVAERSRPRVQGQDPLLTNHGGIAVISSNTLPLQTLSLSVAPTTFELVCVRVSRKSTSSNILLVYRTGPISNLFFEELSNVLDIVRSFNVPLIVAGDMNIHIERQDSCDTRKLLEIMSDHGLSCRIREPTHNQGGTLDLIFTTEFVTVTTHETGLSDHTLLLWQSRFPQSPLNYVTSIYRPWNKLVMDDFRNCLQDSVLCSPHTWSNQDVNQLACTYDKTLYDILDKLIPMKKMRKSKRPSDFWFDEECRRAKRSVRWYERLYRTLQSHSSTSTDAIRSTWRRNLYHYRALLRRKRSHFWSEKVNSERNDPRRLWRSFDSLMGRGRSPVPPCVTAFDFHRFFESRFSATPLTSSVSCDSSPDSIPCSLSTVADTSVSVAHLPEFRPVSISEVSLYLRRLRNKFSVCDPIPTNILKDCSDLILPFLTHLLNRSLVSGIFPSHWKNACISPIPKKGSCDIFECTSYRPISNLPVLSKLMESIVSTQLLRHVGENDLFPSSQSAYRSRHSTETVILKVLSDILKSFDKRHVSLLAFLDLSSAFDCVNHSILLDKLRSCFYVTDTVLKWFSSFLHNRTFFVRHNVSTSPTTLSRGVPQGSVLGPILFILYTSNLIPRVESLGLSIQMFADDILIYGSSNIKEALQLCSKLSLCSDIVKDWLVTNDLILNASKTKLMWCHSSRLALSLARDPIRFCDQLVIPVSSVRYLGVILDCHMTLSKNISLTVSSCFSQLRRIRSIRKCLTAELTLTLVNYLVLSRVDYCIAAHSGLPMTSLRRLQRILHAAARLVTGASKFDHVKPMLQELGWLPIQSKISLRLGSLAFLCLNGQAPSYLASELTESSTIPARTRLRSTSSRSLTVPLVRHPTTGGRTFAASATKVWNSLPRHLTTANDFKNFKTDFKKILLCNET